MTKCKNCGHEIVKVPAGTRTDDYHVEYRDGDISRCDCGCAHQEPKEAGK